MKKRKTFIIVFIILLFFTGWVIYKKTNLIKDWCPADLNKDKIVNEADLEILKNSVGKPCECASCDCPTDLNKDGKTNAADIGILLEEIGSECRSGIF